jgi:hypothetical protein
MTSIKNRSKIKSALVIIPVFTFFTLISCGPAKQDSEQTQQVPALPQNQEKPAPSSTEPAQPLETETEQPSAEQNNTEVMRNPPHGEPNHRCDIPVGAPLDSPPANTNRQTTNNQAQATSSQNINTAPDIANNPTAPTIENARRMSSSQTRSTAAPATGTKPRLNPPHGQPWHRCDIAVGSPLP